MEKDIKKTNPLTPNELAKYELIAYTDGACRSKKGNKIGTAAFIIYDRDHNIIKSHAEPVEENVSNNVCEYKALIILLHYMVR